MYHIKDDQRSIRSSKMLYDGLARLMHKMPFNSIKVKDLIEEAEVARATFYRNFDEIEDILRLRCDQALDGFLEYLVEYMQNDANGSYTGPLKPLLRYFYLHSEVIELLVLAKRMDIVQSSFRRVMEPFKILAAARYSIDESYQDYVFNIRIDIGISILVRWIETGKTQAPDELADKLGAIIENLVTIDQLL